MHSPPTEIITSIAFRENKHSAESPGCLAVWTGALATTTEPLIEADAMEGLPTRPAVQLG